MESHPLLYKIVEPVCGNVYSPHDDPEDHDDLEDHDDPEDPDGPYYDAPPYPPEEGDQEDWSHMVSAVRDAYVDK